MSLVCWVHVMSRLQIWGVLHGLSLQVPLLRWPSDSAAPKQQHLQKGYGVPSGGLLVEGSIAWDWAGVHCSARQFPPECRRVSSTQRCRLTLRCQMLTSAGMPAYHEQLPADSRHQQTSSSWLHSFCPSGRPPSSVLSQHDVDVDRRPALGTTAGGACFMLPVFALLPRYLTRSVSLCQNVSGFFHQPRVTSSFSIRSLCSETTLPHARLLTLIQQFQYR